MTWLFVKYAYRSYINKDYSNIVPIILFWALPRVPKFPKYWVKINFTADAIETVLYPERLEIHPLWTPTSNRSFFSNFWLNGYKK